MSEPFSGRRRVLVTSTMRTSFIERDVTILEGMFDVAVFIGSGPAAVAGILRQVKSADVAVSWFLSVYSFFMVAAARLQRIPSVIILGGVDTARDDRIGYGIWRSAWRRPLLRWTLRHATRIFAVDASLMRALEASSDLHDLPITVLPTGYDSTFWTPSNQRGRLVLCVAGCDSSGRILVKGLDVLIAAARRMPSASFHIVGTDATLLAALDSPTNVRITASLGADDLRDAYRAAAVYCQPSRHEGLPNALCEAMLCGCIPVASNVGGIAGAIGDCGYVVPPDDIDALVGALSRALDDDESKRECARARIVSRYSGDARRSGLTAAIAELLDA